MSGITVERRPGGSLLVAGLFAHPEMLDAVVGLLVDSGVLEAATRVEAWDRARLDTPAGSVEDQAFYAARAELADLLGSVLVAFRPRDLEPVADAVDAERGRKLVNA